MSVIDSILEQLDGYRWGLIRARATARGQKRATIVSEQQANGSDDLAVGKESARTAMHTADLAGLQEQISDSRLPSAEKEALALFVRRSALLITGDDWDEYIARMKQMVGLKAALQNEYRLAGRLADALEELDGADVRNGGASDL